MRSRAAALLLVGLLTACSSTSGDVAAPAAPSGPATAASPAAPTGEDVLWLCAPELEDDPCDGGLETASVALDGTATAGRSEPAEDPPVDCLYVYPTVSSAPGTNAPLEADDDVVAAVRAQAVRFAEVCELHVPVYRQLTRGSILTGQFFQPGPRDVAYGDVLAAWQALLARDPDRGVVLVGHSQGAMLLTRLLAEQVSGRPEVQQRLVSALLVGGNLTVPAGQDAGGDAGDVPACRRPGQTRCVVAYSSFAEVPPPGAFFGRAAAGRQVVCTDPGRLAGGDGDLRPALPTGLLSPGAGGVSVPDGTEAELVDYPGSLTAQCREQAGASWLQVSPVPGAPLPVPAQVLGPDWGLHVADVNLALGDLVELVGRQAEGWASGS